MALLTIPQRDPAFVEEGLVRCRKAFDRYGVLEDTAWAARPLTTSLPATDRVRIRRYLGELLMASRNPHWPGGRGEIVRAGGGSVSGVGAPGPSGGLLRGWGYPPTPVLARAELSRVLGRPGDEEGRLRHGRGHCLPWPMPSNSFSRIPDGSMPNGSAS